MIMKTSAFSLAFLCIVTCFFVECGKKTESVNIEGKEELKNTRIDQVEPLMPPEPVETLAVQNDTDEELPPDTFKISSKPKVIKPTKVYMMSNKTYKDYQNGEENLNDPIYKALYFGGCSWYCGGVVDTIVASQCHYPESGKTYEAENAHDFNHETAWVTKGNGCGESITFTFPEGCPRVNSVAIVNGYAANNRLWKANSRVKTLSVYYNDKLYCTLNLQDKRALQRFDLDILGYPPNTKYSKPWKLKFVIKEIYRGNKYEDTAISEFVYDGIDVH